MKFFLLPLFCLLAGQITFAQTNYFSKSTATDFNDVNSWGDVADGTGASPITISNADIFNIANSAQLVLNADASVGNLKFIMGKLTINANTLTVGFAGRNNSVVNFAAGGFLTMTAGTLDVRGAMYFQNGSGLTQSGGLIKIDGNNGGDVATSVAAGTMFLGFGIIPAGTNTANTADLTSAGVANFVLTGGTIQIVDGTASNTAYDLVGYRSTGTGAAPISLLCAVGHTFEFGDGVSTDPIGNIDGLLANVNMAGGFLSFGKIKVNIAGGQNRFLKTKNNFSIRGDLEVIKGAIIVANTLYLEGNLNNQDTVATISGGTFSFQKYLGVTGGLVAPVTTAQTISGNGKFINSYTAPTANFTNLTINNKPSIPTAIVIPANMISGVGTGSISGILTLTNGYLDIQNTPLIMGIGTVAATTVNITAANNSAIIGEVQHWFPAGTTTTQKNYQVGILGRNNNFVLRFPSAISSGGRVSVKFSANAISLAGLPIAAEAGNANINIELVSPSGYWTVEPLAGLTLGTGTYTVNANASGFTKTDGITPLTATIGLALIKRPTGGSWATGASGTAGVSALSNFFRQNMTDFSEFAIGGTALVLPIKLSLFEGKATGNVNTLSWTSENEINSDKFIVERSSNSIDFSAIGIVKSSTTNGNSSTLVKYSFIDKNPNYQVQYYRLKMIDLNGTFEYSDIVTIKQSRLKLQLIDVKPNPTSGLVTFNISGISNDANIIVRNVMGQVVVTKTAVQTNVVTMDLQHLANGIYVIEVIDTITNEKVIQKIIKQ
jgi:hypothetical protein